MKQPNTSDDEYASLLAHLATIPAQQPETRSLTREQERTHLHEDLLSKNGEATW